MAEDKWEKAAGSCDFCKTFFKGQFQIFLVVILKGFAEVERKEKQKRQVELS